MNKKHIAVIILLTVALAVQALLAEYGFIKMENKYVDNYMKQQEEAVMLLNYHLEYMLGQGAPEEELIGFMAQKVPVSGSSYHWLSKDDTVIFARSLEVTEDLKELQQFSLFQDVISQKEGVCLVTQEFSYHEQNYVSGMVVDRDYILDNWNLGTYKMYESILMGVLALGQISLLIYYVQLFLKGRRKNRKLEEDLQHKNGVLEELYHINGELNESVMRHQRQMFKEQIYDLQMAKKLLSKSQREDIYPAFYGIFQIKMDEGQYYGKQQMINIMEQIEIDNRHLMIEIHKGNFIILFYKTPEIEMKGIIDSALTKWKQSDIMVEVQSGSIELGTPARKKLDEFLDGEGSVQ